MNIKLCLLVGLILTLSSGCIDNKSNDITLNTEVLDTIKENALVDLSLSGWYINENNDEQIFFDFWIYNYGNVEAKNINISCYLVDEKENVMFNTSYSFGNLASTSYKFDEIFYEYKTNPSLLYSGACFIDTCSDCEILYKRIPELTKLRDKLR